MISKLKEIKYFILYKLESHKNKEINNFYKNLKILDDIDTIKLITSSSVSICRFGDGEFKWLLMDETSPGFQDNSYELSKRLKEILTSKNDKILICIPKNLQYIKDAKNTDKWFWRKFINDYGKKISIFLDSKKVYGNTNLTRFYIGYKSKNMAKIRLQNLKSIWNEKNILIVEGEYTRLGVGNDLLNNAKSVKRLICPSKNAFFKYDKILDTIKSVFDGDLILIALGPTATVLAYDLALSGYQAIDIGHIDVEYEWFLKNATEKIAIDGKAVNEAKKSKNENMDINDKKYLDSIIKRI